MTGFLAEQGAVLVWIWAAVLVAATFLLGRAFPQLKPRYEGLGASEETSGELASS